MPAYNQDDLRDASEHLADYVVNYTDREIGRDRKFICFNPDHQDTHPSMSIFKTDAGIWKARCFVCHKTYDLADVIGINEGLTEKRDQLARIKDLYGIEIRLEEKGDPTGYKKSRPKHWESQDSTIDSKRIDLTAQAEQAHSSLTDVMREAWERARGITPEVIDRFKLGHYRAGLGELLKDFPELSRGKWESFSIILPDYDSLGVCRYLIAESFENLKFMLAVNQGKEPGMEKPRHKYQALAGMRKPVWNSKALEGNEPMIAITEGVYDALSFESAGLSAVSILGTEAKQLIGIIERIKPESVFLLALDNDDAGRKAQEDLKRQLERIGARYVEFPLEDASV